MPRTTASFPEFQNITLTGMGSMTLPDAIKASLDEIQARVAAGDALPFQNSWVDEVASLMNTTFNDSGYKPNGDHLGGRNVESELQQGRLDLITVRDDEDRDAAIRAATIPAIASLEQQIERGDFMRHVRDPEWGGDILELVTRLAPHERYGWTFVRDDETGELSKLWVAETVHIKVETLSAEIDQYGEICVWLYDE